MGTKGKRKHRRAIAAGRISRKHIRAMIAEGGIRRREGTRSMTKALIRGVK